MSRAWHFDFVRMDSHKNNDIVMDEAKTLYGVFPVPPTNDEVVAIFIGRDASTSEKEAADQAAAEQAELEAAVNDAAAYYEIPVRELTQEQFAAYMQLKASADAGVESVVDEAAVDAAEAALKEATEDGS